MLKFYKDPGLKTCESEQVVKKLRSCLHDKEICNIQTETCFYINTEDRDLSISDREKLQWILSTPFQEDKLSLNSHICIEAGDRSHLLVEIGPRLNFSTPFSTNAVSICKSIGVCQVERIECSTRYSITFSAAITDDDEQSIVGCLHDKMTQCRYKEPIKSFKLDLKSDEVYEVDVLKDGRSALEKANRELGLAFDDWDLEYYTNLFSNSIKRNPTSVECFDLAQSNSEHSRHWFFKGRMDIDGEEQNDSLFKMIMGTQMFTNNNNIIKFTDNSSGIEGFSVHTIAPDNPTQPSIMRLKDRCQRHIIFTAETHNFPTGVAPFPGATTGTGGRIRDVHCTGKGAHVVAGTAGYSFGNLNIPGYVLPWEDSSFEYPSNFASPLEIAVEASNGASDYGNKFGEPVLAGFARSFGMQLTKGERREFMKPIMFSGGIGILEDGHIKKDVAEKGMEVVKIGGPVYRIGVGGGAASSVQVQGDNKSELDFGAVQRGDAEMEQKLNRLIRACIEMKGKNPICSIHDQGAGGNGNVLKELVEPAGAVIYADNFHLGDPTISILELWGAEYQETNALLVRSENREVLKTIGERERCPVSFVGTVTGNGKIELVNFSKKSKDVHADGLERQNMRSTELPVNLELEHVLGSMPRKLFQLTKVPPIVSPLNLPDSLQVLDALHRVLRLPSVASKRYLTNKVDRCVTGLVAKQQCVGPLHTPLADVAVTALSYFDTVGSATAIGEQPIKGLVSPECGARMSVGEALTNLVFARVTSLKDVKCSGNWMWPAKLPGEGAALYSACKAMCDIMKKLGIGIDGGKDSLSMAARMKDQTVKAPGTLVISTYVGCPDITATVTPDLKCPGGKGALLYVDISNGKHRIGGTALAQCYSQIGDTSADLDDPDLFTTAFNITQGLIADKFIESGHDVSDGGLITCILEMAFAGNCGCDVNIQDKSQDSVLNILFAEELGLIIEVTEKNTATVLQQYRDAGVACYRIGDSTADKSIKICINSDCVLEADTIELRDVWEETSFQLETRQTNPKCVQEEKLGLKHRLQPGYHLPFAPFCPDIPLSISDDAPKIGVIREEGSNSDREMSAAFYLAGFQVWDVCMQDLCDSKITLDRFHGLAFVGGFSYADVLGSAKGWAATALFNRSVNEQFRRFKNRTDTFSLAVCNGCQLLALLGYIAPDNQVMDSGDGHGKQGVFLDHNTSERFECRFATVKVESSPSVLLKGMEGLVFGIWVAHGEGKMVFKNDSILNSVLDKNLAPVRYVDDTGKSTTQYPQNPNGSPNGIAAITSEDGRHLAIMPHPERCFLPWQCPWMPQDIRRNLKASPWLKIFQNAYTWCMESS